MLLVFWVLGQGLFLFWIWYDLQGILAVLENERRERAALWRAAEYSKQERNGRKHEETLE